MKPSRPRKYSSIYAVVLLLLLTSGRASLFFSQAQDPSQHQDAGIAATIKTLDRALNDYKIEHMFEIYDGNHTNRVAERIETKALPFFSKNLSFDRAETSRGIDHAFAQRFRRAMIAIY